MHYIVEYLKDTRNGCEEWARSTNPHTDGQYNSRSEAETALSKNTHFVAKLFQFRIKELQEGKVAGGWVSRPELVCSKCGKAGQLQLWLPWDANTPQNFHSHRCVSALKGCGASWRDEAAMLALYGSQPGTTTVQVFGSSNSIGKEEKMFQVTVYIFATGEVKNALTDRLCAAKENLEKQVAGFRASGLTANKVFFTASILDTKTGKYHGFVSDPPPAIKLEGEN